MSVMNVNEPVCMCLCFPLTNSYIVSTINLSCVRVYDQHKYAIDLFLGPYLWHTIFLKLENTLCSAPSRPPSTRKMDGHPSYYMQQSAQRTGNYTSGHDFPGTLNGFHGMPEPEIANFGGKSARPQTAAEYRKNQFLELHIDPGLQVQQCSLALSTYHSSRTFIIICLILQEMQLRKCLWTTGTRNTHAYMQNNRN